jgi:hypothetical protein
MTEWAPSLTAALAVSLVSLSGFACEQIGLNPIADDH